MRRIEIEIDSAGIGVRAFFLTVLEAFWVAFFLSCGIGASAASHMTVGLRMRCERREIMIE